MLYRSEADVGDPEAKSAGKTPENADNGLGIFQPDCTFRRPITSLQQR